jgi:4-hydroxybenzoate polyprenyltransferase
VEYLNLIRLHQWIKNILIFLPLLAVKDFSKDNFGIGILTFFLFSILCSSNYILNDLIDLAKDRKDKFKKKRSIAAKKISKTLAAIIAISLFCISTVCTYIFLGPGILNFFFIYYFICIFYSLVLKHINALDIFCLTIFYLLRIFIGGYVFGLDLSIWIYAYSFFIFFALAVIKKSIQLKKNIYHYNDKILFMITSVSSSMVAGLVVFLYGISENFDIYYHNNKPLLFIISFSTIFYFLRINKLVFNKKILDDDIIKFVLKDRISYVIFFILVCSYIGSDYF